MNEWENGYKEGEADGRKHARAAIARALRARADAMEAEASKLLPILTNQRQSTFDKLKAREDLTRDLADKIETGAFEGPDKETCA